MTNHSVIIRVSYSMEHLHMHNSIRSICKQENTPRWSLTAVITWVIKEYEMARTKRIEYISLPLEQLQDYHPHLRFAEWLSLSLQWAHEEGNTRWIQWILFRRVIIHGIALISVWREWPIDLLPSGHGNLWFGDENNTPFLSVVENTVKIPGECGIENRLK